ncbi:hypothetical protein Skr01_59980 [Sphaerisporangium krabiense]|nr:hypothetical protein Skr01_59980 [Sphaerisporangium krabiense]
MPGAGGGGRRGGGLALRAEHARGGQARAEQARAPEHLAPRQLGGGELGVRDGQVGDRAEAGPFGVVRVRVCVIVGVCVIVRVIVPVAQFLAFPDADRIDLGPVHQEPSQKALNSM